MKRQPPGPSATQIGALNSNSRTPEGTRPSRIARRRPLELGLRQRRVPQPGGVLRGRCTESTAIVPAELGRALVTDRVGGTGHVVRVSDEPDPRFLQPDLLL